MKTVALIMLALFSFLHEEKYPVSDYKCDNNEIKIMYEDTWYDVSLFNVFLKEDESICGYLNEDMYFEFDSYVSIANPLNVYLFVEDDLLQQTLIEDNKATIKIDNPKYKYVLKKQSKKVMKEVKDVNATDVVMTNSKKIAIGCIVVWIIMIFILWIRHHRKKTENDIQTRQEHEKLESEQKE